jgi:hypothetical protein
MAVREVAIAAVDPGLLDRGPHPWNVAVCERDVRRVAGVVGEVVGDAGDRRREGELGPLGPLRIASAAACRPRAAVL